MQADFRITLAQLNPTVGALAQNVELAKAAYSESLEANADFMALPEMFLTGYQTQDLVQKPAFLDDVDHHIKVLAEITRGQKTNIGVGAPLRQDDALFNAYYILGDGIVQAVITKHFLPNSNVFDELRLFDQGAICGPYRVGPARLGSPICEDAWHPDVCETLAESGANILVVPNGSPYYREKLEVRHQLMVQRVVETGLPLVYLNLVGGQDDQMFDGGSFVLNPGGELAVQMPMFEEAICHVDFIQTPEGWRAIPGEKILPAPMVGQDYRVMVETLRDYLRKSGFSKVVLGLSGGIDSAIVATIAADAIGPQNVHCVMLPSEYTSTESLEDATAVASALGCRLDTIPISAARSAITETLAPLFEGYKPDLTEENIQSRLRGLLLMALSNKFGEMLLTTGNKSEVAVGYATIYGDMAGGYNPIKDLYKTRVFETCRWRNTAHFDWMLAPAGEVIPPRVIEKPPSAELRPDQKDEDSLPPYDILDGILIMLIEEEASVADCVAAGYDRETVKRVEHLLFISEYKRFQSAPGPRLSGRAFWLDRRYPIVNRWRDPS